MMKYEWVNGNLEKAEYMMKSREEQIVAAYKENIHPIPAFVIEIISPNEKGTKIKKKALEYFEAGVQVIWQLYPELAMVKVCFGNDVCAAKPVVSDLQITVNELFGIEKKVG